MGNTSQLDLNVRFIAS